MRLRPYQERSVAAVKGAFRAGARRIVLVAPTGAGKTVMGVAVVSGALAKGRRVLWLAHRRELVGQASARLDLVGATAHGVLLAGHPRANPTAPIQVASVQTLTVRGSSALPPADIIILDEAHHAVAATWRELAAAYPNAEMVLGLTATPERGDRTPLGDVFQALVAEIRMRELLDGGFLVPCDVIAPAAPQDELAEDPLDALAKHAPGRPAILFGSSVAHAQELAAAARRRGLRAECVDGATATDKREAALAAFAAGRLDLITNVFVLTEGFDAPRAEVCILARGCSATGTYLQMVGRVLRPSPATGKRRAMLIDLRGLVHVHGMPDDERTYSLTGRAIRSSGTAEDVAPLRQCQACGATFRWAPECPRCGARQPPRPAPRVKRAPLAAVTAAQIVPMAAKRAHFDALAKTCRERRYSPKWVGVQFKQRFGHWPPWPMPSEARSA